MTYTIEEKRVLDNSISSVFQSALKAITNLEGKVTRQEVDKNEIDAAFPKTILGKVLGDRTNLFVILKEVSENQTEIYATIYPVDPIGRKMTFGARKGVSSTVLKWFFAHLENQLK